MALQHDPRTGLFSWTKGDYAQLSPNFGTKEMTCPCMYRTCVTQFAHDSLLSRLQQLRETLGLPITVNSGYRCQAHQLDLLHKGYQATTGTSQHTLGHAADIECPQDADQLYADAQQLFTAIGKASNWIHVDTRPGNFRWTYT